MDRFMLKVVVGYPIPFHPERASGLRDGDEVFPAG